MELTLRGARLLDAVIDIAEGDITIHGSFIKDIERGSSHQKANHIIDVSGTIILPGFIDVHTHGGGGWSLHTRDVNEIGAYTRWIPATGVTSFLIGVLGVPGTIPEQQLSTAVTSIEQHTRGKGAEPVGIHLEGPYISEQHRGAHATTWLRVPDARETKMILTLTKKHLRLVTLAPELPGAMEMIQHLVEAGVTVSIGHTDADYIQARAAIEAGITHMTHCFNAMRPLHHRQPGPLAAVAQSEQILGELIADGVHVHPAMMELLVRLLGPARTIVVTDALPGAGIADASFAFAGYEVHVEDGAARLPDHTLCGSILTMDQGWRNMLAMTHVSLQEAVRMVTYNPARAAGVARQKGRLLVGYDADLLIVDPSLHILATICQGQVAFVAEAWRNHFSFD